MPAHDAGLAALVVTKDETCAGTIGREHEPRQALVVDFLSSRYEDRLSGLETEVSHSAGLAHQGRARYGHVDGAHQRAAIRKQGFEPVAIRQRLPQDQRPILLVAIVLSPFEDPRRYRIVIGAGEGRDGRSGTLDQFGGPSDQSRNALGGHVSRLLRPGLGHDENILVRENAIDLGLSCRFVVEKACAKSLNFRSLQARPPAQHGFDQTRFAAPDEVDIFPIRCLAPLAQAPPGVIVVEFSVREDEGREMDAGKRHDRIDHQVHTDLDKVGLLDFPGHVRPVDTFDDFRAFPLTPEAKVSDEVSLLGSGPTMLVDAPQAVDRMAVPVDAGLVDRAVDRQLVRSTWIQNDPAHDLGRLVQGDLGLWRKRDDQRQADLRQALAYR